MAPRPEFRLDVFQGMGWTWLAFANVDVLYGWFGWPSAYVENTLAIVLQYGVACWFLFGAHLVDVWLWKRRRRERAEPADELPRSPPR